jgi:hypothetical protein
LEFVAAVKGWPLKNVVWMSFGASFGDAANTGTATTNKAAPPQTPAIRACIPIPQNS